MTKPLPQRDVEARPTRSGKPRLNAIEKKALASIKDENLKKVLGELLISSRETQENFQEIEQWFPIQPADIALRGIGIENQGENDASRYWLKWLRKGTKKAAATIRAWFEKETGFHELRLAVQGDPEKESESGTRFADVRIFTNDDEDFSGVQLVVGGGSRYLLRRQAGSTAQSDFLQVNSKRQLPAGSLEKGSLVTADGVDLPRILQVGEDGKLLVADSTTSRGLKWKTPEEAGLKGLEGRWAGFKYTFLTNTEATDPGAGKVKFDKPFAEATSLRISETDKDGNALAAFLATIDDSTSAVKGHLIVRKVAEPKTFAVYNLTGGLTDNGTWDSIPIAFVAGAGLANNDEVVVEFLRTGDKGDVGEKGEKGTEGAKGAEGAKGSTGAEGRWASLRYAYLTNTEETEPAAGKLKFNAGKTSLRISETDGDGGGLSAYLAAWDDSTTLGARGFVVIRKIGTPATFAVYKITGALVDKGTWDILPVELVSSGGAFANEDPISVEFYRTGDKGEQGEKGATGEKGEAGTGLTGEAEEDLEGTWPKLLIRKLKVTTAKIAADAVTGVKIKLGNAEKIRWFKEATETAYLFANETYAEFARTSGEKRASLLVEIETGLAKVEALILKPGEIRRTILDEEERSHFLQLSGLGKFKDYGLVSALPASPVLGDRCQYIADKANGIIWQLVYDGEGTYPWKKIGGPPFYAEAEASVETKSTTYVSPTGALAIKCPLKGTYDVTQETGGLQSLGNTIGALMSHSIGAVAASDAWCLAVLSSGATVVVAPGVLTHRHTGVVAGDEVVEKLKSQNAAQAATASRRRLKVDPIRVG